VTGIESLEEILGELAARGTDLIVARAKLQIRESLSRAGLMDRIGVDKFHRSVGGAVQSCANV